MGKGLSENACGLRRGFVPGKGRVRAFGGRWMGKKRRHMNRVN